MVLGLPPTCNDEHCWGNVHHQLFGNNSCFMCEYVRASEFWQCPKTVLIALTELRSTNEISASDHVIYYDPPKMVTVEFRYIDYTMITHITAAYSLAYVVSPSHILQRRILCLRIAVNDPMSSGSSMVVQLIGWISRATTLCFVPPPRTWNYMGRQSHQHLGTVYVRQIGQSILDLHDIESNMYCTKFPVLTTLQWLKKLPL